MEPWIVMKYMMRCLKWCKVLTMGSRKITTYCKSSQRGRSIHRSTDIQEVFACATFRRRCSQEIGMAGSPSQNGPSPRTWHRASKNLRARKPADFAQVQMLMPAVFGTCTCTTGPPPRARRHCSKISNAPQSLCSQSGSASRAPLDLWCHSMRFLLSTGKARRGGHSARTASTNTSTASHASILGARPRRPAKAPAAQPASWGRGSSTSSLTQATTPKASTARSAAQPARRRGRCS
mmetsp:Transcript_6668/g.24933  ORF Transcript_6668/g.24933 Transcript_6668/m.24933 type:complete len:236 (-) Transcript_6668:553-1260(-)